MLNSSKLNGRLIKQQETRQKLLDAAHQAVVQYGYQGASIVEIVKIAGFTKGAFFSNFQNKEEILLELLRIQKDEDLKLLKSHIMSTNNDLCLALEKYISTLDDRRDCAMLDIELQLYARNNEKFAELYSAIQKENRLAMGGLLENIFALSGKSISMKPVELADLFIALVHGVAIQNNGKAGNFVHLVLHSLISVAEPK